jgi:hypothetical protein
MESAGNVEPLTVRLANADSRFEIRNNSKQLEPRTSKLAIGADAMLGLGEGEVVWSAVIP